MSKKNPRTRGSGGVPMPSAEVIRSRFFRTSGTVSTLIGHVIASDGIAIGGKHNDEAQAYEITGGGYYEGISFGRFNPATGKWCLAPEYVTREEQPAVERLLRNQALSKVQQTNARQVEAGTTTVDLYHPYTRKVRARMAELMKPLGNFLGRPAVRQAMARPDSRVIAVDGATFVFPNMATEIWATPIVEELGDGESVTHEAITMYEYNRLTLAVRGVKVDNPTGGPGTSIRGVRSVVLARRDDERPDIWVPNVEVVDPVHDWPAVSRIAEALEHAHAENPDFSMLHCAVSYGREYGAVSVNPAEPV